MQIQPNVTLRLGLGVWDLWTSRSRNQGSWSRSRLGRVDERLGLGLGLRV